MWLNVLCMNSRPRLDDITDLLEQFLTYMTSVLVQSHGGSGFERFTTWWTEEGVTVLKVGLHVFSHTHLASVWLTTLATAPGTISEREWRILDWWHCPVIISIFTSMSNSYCLIVMTPNTAGYIILGIKKRFRVSKTHFADLFIRRKCLKIWRLKKVWWSCCWMRLQQLRWRIGEWGNPHDLKKGDWKIHTDSRKLKQIWPEAEGRGLDLL